MWRLWKSWWMCILCPSALGCSSPRKASGGSPILQECLNRAIRGAADRTRGGVNGRVPGSRTLLQTKPKGTCRHAVRKSRWMSSDSQSRVCLCNKSFNQWTVRPVNLFCLTSVNHSTQIAMKNFFLLVAVNLIINLWTQFYNSFCLVTHFCRSSNKC